jgi:hypothetical protein
VAWHPRSGNLATLGATSGRVFLWAPTFRENWAKFAPGFAELEENEEYAEREDEFDRNPRTGDRAGEPGPWGVRPALVGGVAPDDEGGDEEVELFALEGKEERRRKRQRTTNPLLLCSLSRPRTRASWRRATGTSRAAS